MRDRIRKITAAVILGLLLVTVGAETDTAVFCLAAENGSDTAEQAETVTKAGLEPAPDTEGEKIAGPKLCAQSAVLMDASTGRILYGKEETIKRPMASTTKIMTCILALEQGKEVFSLPGRRIDPLSEGCNRLIAQGAGIVTKPEDVLDFFHIKCKNSCKKTIKSVNALAKSEKMVYSCLDSQPKHLEAVMKSCGVTAGECMTALLNLEMQGLILQPMNQYYVRKII